MPTGNMKEIKQRIKNVQGIMQITKAMELVSSVKLKRVKEKSAQAVRFTEEYRDLLHELSMTDEALTSPFIQKRNQKRNGVTLNIVVAGERGLSGAYNYNILKLAEEESLNQKVKYITIGKQATSYFQKSGAEIVESYSGIFEKLSLDDALLIGEKAKALYLSGEVNKIKLFATRFKSALVQTAESHRVLPRRKTMIKPVKTNYVREPKTNDLFNMLVPLYIGHMLYAGILESFASEQASTRLAMEGATKSADEMLDALQFQYNRARQAGITQELTEIVSGANPG